MTILDLDALRRASLQTDPFSFVVVPHFVRTEQLAEVNRDYPEIAGPGNFELAGLRYGPAFAASVRELESSELREAMAGKFGLDLHGYPLRPRCGASQSTPTATSTTTHGPRS